MGTLISSFSEPDITTEECRETSNIFTLPPFHNISVLEKTTKLPTPHLMTVIYQNKHYHIMCTKLAQLRANKSPLMQSYLHTVNPKTYMPHAYYDTNHLYNCSQVPHNTTTLVCGKSL